MKRVYLLMVVAVLCLGAEMAFAQPPSAPGEVVRAPAILVNNSHVNTTIDFGFIVCEGVIGDRVWKDINWNGLQDDGEPGISGAVVTLIDSSGNIKRPPVTTNESGIYLFEGLCAGNYTVTVVPPSADYIPTKPNQGNDDSIDSDGLNATNSEG